MEDIKVLLCRLCLTAIDGENYETIDPAGVLLLKLDYDSSKNIMCNICSPRLSAALKFKSTCLDTNDSIISYINDPTVLPMDLKEIYTKEKECKYIPDDVKVCRLCMQPINNISETISLNDEHTDMIQKFVPDMNIFIINEPVMCKFCVDSLTLHYNFLNKCWDQEETDGSICNGQIPDAPSPAPSLHAYVKLEDDIDLEVVEQLNQIEYMVTNYAEIKTESETPAQEMCLPSAETECYNKDNITNNKKIVEIYRYQNCNYKTGRKWDIQRNVKIPQKCKWTNMKSRIVKLSLKDHMLMHKNSSKEHMYKCEICNFETKHKGSLKLHVLLHKDPSEVQMYKCDNCNYATKYKQYLKKHVLVHKDSSEVQMYKCQNCDYKNKFKYKLKRHVLIHKDPSEVQMYKCQNCDFKTKFKYGLKRHVLIHKDPSEVQMYKCEICNYETKLNPFLPIVLK